MGIAYFLTSTEVVRITDYPTVEDVRSLHLKLETKRSKFCKVSFSRCECGMMPSIFIIYEWKIAVATLHGSVQQTLREILKT